MTKAQRETEVAIAVYQERIRIEAEIHRLMFSASMTSAGIEALTELFKAIQPPARRFTPR